MKKLFILLLLLSFSFAVPSVTYTTGWSTMYAETVHPLRKPLVYINGLTSPYSATSVTMDVPAGDSFVVKVYAEVIDDGFPLDSSNQPYLYYDLYYGYSTQNVLTVSPADAASYTAYLDAGDPVGTQKYRSNSSVQLKNAETTILNVVNSSGDNSWMWLSFNWIMNIPNNAKAALNKNVRINVTVE